MVRGVTFRAYKVGIGFLVFGMLAILVHAMWDEAIVDPDALVLGFLPAFIGLTLIYLDLWHVKR